MPWKQVLAVLATLLAFWQSGNGFAQTEEGIVLQTPRGVRQPFLLIRVDSPKVAVILFTGGNGALNLDGTVIRSSTNNFLVRSRAAFARRGLMVAVIDAPSDNRKIGADFRISADHDSDIGAVVDRLRSIANVPVWLVGTSMGTFSAANEAIRLQDRIAGLALASPVTRSSKRWSVPGSYPDGVANLRLDEVTVPVLIAAHRDDKCRVTPPSKAKKLAAAFTASRNVAVKLFNGGDPQTSRSCGALSAHGYIGIEGKVVDAITDFILDNIDDRSKNR